MRYGKRKDTTTLDDNGSTVTVERNYMNSSVTLPVRRYYEYRVKVKDKKEEMTEYLKFSDSLDAKKLEPEFKLDYTKHGDENGYYFVVKCWVILDYGDTNE